MHLSATPRSAREILLRAVPVLVAARCAFKVACDEAEVVRLNGRNADRGSSGKFVTVYPPSDDDVADLVRALHSVTAGLPGPRILSDRPCQTGSVVHYRYGAFRMVRRLAADGVYDAVLATPDGGYLVDRREAWFTPPDWAPPDPLPVDREPASTVDESAREVLLDGRFALHSAIRHANKGGVFRATDRRTGLPVVVKQGRRHVAVREDGSDIRDQLRNEATVLLLLAPTGMTPRLVGLIERHDHTFLVEELIDGTSLRQHVTGLHHGGDVASDTLIGLALGVVDLVERAHGAGIVLRDLTPSNILVRPDGTLRLVDLEMAAAIGTPVLPGGSPGYAAPEQWSAHVAEIEVDRHGLGAVLFFLLTGVEPVFAQDEPVDRGQSDRMAEWLDRSASASPMAEVWADAVLALTDPVPTRRRSPAQVRATFRQLPSRVGRPAVAHDLVGDAERLLSDGLRYLTSTVREFTTSTSSPWPTDVAGVHTDPGNVYYGAAGVLAVMTEALVVRPTAEIGDAVTALRTWLVGARCPNQPIVHGLLFGRPGTLHALLNAADAVDDDPAVRLLADEAEWLPLTSAVPDVAHGLAGTGLMLLRFWRRTGRATLLGRAVRVARELAMSVEQWDDGGIGWQVPALSSRRPKPVRHHGFAHGTAGIATFLLDVGRAAGVPEFVDLARAAGDTLSAAALRTGDGAARWTAGPNRDLPLAGWCSGAAGVGGFLLRLWHATGVDDYLDLAGEAAVAVHRDRWLAPPGYCHGAAGGADYLVDLALATGDRRYSSWALEMTSPLLAHAARRGDLLLTPDSGGRDVSPGWATGSAGIVGVLLRILNSARPPWSSPVVGPAGDRSPEPMTVRHTVARNEGRME